MRRLEFCWVLISVLMMAVASCQPQPGIGSHGSPISPVATPSLRKGPLKPEGWTPLTIGSLAVYYIDLQIYEPLAWTDIDWDGRHIWLVDNITQRLVSLDQAGEIVRALPFPQVDNLPCNVMGIAVVDSKVWIADVAHRRFYALDQRTGTIVSEFPFTNTPQGIDWDGAALWIATVEGNRLEQRNEQGELLAAYPLQGRWTTGVASDGQQIWYVETSEGNIWAFEPTTGRHERQDDLGVLVNQMSFNGIAWAEDYLLLFDDMRGKLYAIPRNRQTGGR